MLVYVCYQLLRKRFKCEKHFKIKKKFRNQKKKTMKKIIFSFFASCIVSLSICDTASAQTKDEVKKPTDSVNKKKVENRNVMLNASDNTGPRQVNIGLPFRGDIVILENDVPVVYNFYPTIPTTTWRYDSSLAEMGLLSFAESALTTGKVGYAVASSDRDMSMKLKGYFNLYTNNFGSSRFDLTVTGPLGKKGWGYMVAAHENFDRGNGTNYMFTPWSDRTEMFKAGISKKYKKGSFRVLYKYADAAMQIMRYNPLTYEGNGNTSPLDNFKLGSDSYVVRSGIIPYYDAETGVATTADLSQKKWQSNISHTFYLNGDHKFDNGWALKYTTAYSKETSPFPITFPLSLLVKDPDQIAAAKEQYRYLGTNNVYNGSVQWTIAQMMEPSKNTYFTTRIETTKKINEQKLRFGLNQQYYSTQSKTNAGMFMHTVEANPYALDYYKEVAPNYFYKITDASGLMPAVAGGYGSMENYSINKLALYGSDDFKVGKIWSFGLGARVEGQKIHETKNPYINDFAKGRPYITHDFDIQWNKVGNADFVAKVTRDFGFLGDVSYNGWWDRYWDYEFRDANGNPIKDPSAPAGTKPLLNQAKTFQTQVLNYGAGVFYNYGSVFSLVSKITHISKDNIKTNQGITNPANPAERSTFDPIFYGVNTLGWSTDIVARPFKNFNIHALLTLQNPVYKNYQYSAYGVTYDYNDNVHPELSKTLIELDPSYTFNQGKMRAWVSVRYFGEQQGNAINTIYYNGWWENFGGLDYNMNRQVTFKLQVVNFLNQEGVRGALQGADQITDPTPYIGRKVIANGIRPRTIELTASFKF
jgi:hypothetical protein